MDLGLLDEINLVLYEDHGDVSALLLHLHNKTQYFSPRTHRVYSFNATFSTGYLGFLQLRLYFHKDIGIGNSFFRKGNRVLQYIFSPTHITPEGIGFCNSYYTTGYKVL